MHREGKQERWEGQQLSCQSNVNVQNAGGPNAFSERSERDRMASGWCAGKFFRGLRQFFSDATAAHGLIHPSAARQVAHLDERMHLSG